MNLLDRMTLSDRDRDTLRRLDSLRVEGTPGAVERLVDLLAGSPWPVRRAVTAALASLGDRAVDFLCETLRKRRDDESRNAAVVDALVASTGETVEECVLALTESGHGSEDVVCDAIQILGRRQAEIAVPALDALTRHDNENVAVSAIEALGRIGGAMTVLPLLSVVRSGEFFRTFPAIDVLARSGDPRAVDPLVELLGDRYCALEAARGLGRTGDERAIEPLFAMLQRSSESATRIVALALADVHRVQIERRGSAERFEKRLATLTGRESVVRKITQVLPAADPPERVAICELLGWLGVASAAPSLVARLSDPEPVTAAAAQALRGLGKPVESQLIEELRHADGACRKRLLPIVGSARKAVPEVLRCLEDPDPEVRAAACSALARSGRPEAVGPLFAHLSDPDPSVVQAAIAAVQSIGGSETARLAIAAATSRETGLRRAGLRILGYLGLPDSLTVVLEAARDPDERVRDAALSGLPFFESPRAVEALLASAGHEVPATRAAAFRSLGISTDERPEIVARLRVGLADADPWVRYFACQAAGRRRELELASMLAGRLHDPSGQVRVAAVEALSHLDADEARAALLAAADSEDADLRRAALVGLGLSRHPAGLPALFAAARAEEASTRVIAISALGAFGGSEVIDALGLALDDPDEGVRNAALAALAARTDEISTRTLVPALERRDMRDEVLRALSTPAPGRISGLLKGLAGGYRHLAPQIASALARMPGVEGAAALASLMRVEDPIVRRAAAVTLAGVGSPVADAALRAARTDADPEVRRIAAAAIRT